MFGDCGCVLHIACVYKRIFEAMLGVFGKENVAWAQVYGRVAIRRELLQEFPYVVCGGLYFGRLFGPSRLFSAC